MLLLELLSECQKVAPIIFIAELPAGHTAGPAQPVVYHGYPRTKLPWVAPLGLGRPSHLPGKGERVGVQGPCLQDAGDCLEVISVADDVQATTGWR